jgi:hypothetical protein
MGVPAKLLRVRVDSANSPFNKFLVFEHLHRVFDSCLNFVTKASVRPEGKNRSQDNANVGR